MTDIKSIGVSSIKPDLKSNTGDKRLQGSDEAFDILLENLKSVEHELDSALQNPSTDSPTAVSNSVNALSNYIKKIEGIVEKISPDHQVASTVKNYAISQYEQNNSGKKT